MSEGVHSVGSVRGAFSEQERQKLVGLQCLQLESKLKVFDLEFILNPSFKASSFPYLADFTKEEEERNDKLFENFCLSESERYSREVRAFVSGRKAN